MYVIPRLSKWGASQWAFHNLYYNLFFLTYLTGYNVMKQIDQLENPLPPLCLCARDFY